MQRRDFLRMLAAAAVPGAAASNLLAADAGSAAIGEPHVGPQPLDYAWLKGAARALAQSAYRAPVSDVPDQIKRLSWSRYQAIRYRAERALWVREGLRFGVRFFHPGWIFLSPVRMHEVVGGKAREILYDPAMFDYGASELEASRMPRNLGFAGFQLYTHLDAARDVAAFLGASYFRAVGVEMQYGLSARGLAVDCGLDRPEEFPLFTSFWFERPGKDSGQLTVYALLDSASVTGAYRFEIYPAATLVMEVDATLYPRREIERIGIAPLTSMFLYGENDRREAKDWRPEIHDSDGLAMWTGRGEWIWRPLTNPEKLRFSAFSDQDPRGFGLLQRDRQFDHYQDDGVFYDLRPSLWVEPKSGWGRGAVHLVELPAADETVDNIVAFWNPAQRPRSGDELRFSYRLHWGAQMPFGTQLAQVVATRTGIGGIIGERRKYFSWRFIVDFSGGTLARLGRVVKVEPVITASRGAIEITSARPLHSVQGYRAIFDLKPNDDSVEPVDLRLYLRAGGEPLTETWTYQWTPPPPHQRRV